ncbi:MAG: ribonuclease H-like domain-containing protein [Desulfobacterota bacterium]|nr:ribonuclease H-like domain-containing protein [Thermodesulfobacteriota bacterium]
MIEHTFTFLQGIGRTREQRLWQEGIRCWDDFLSAQAIPWMSNEQKRWYDAQLYMVQDRLRARDAAFFARFLKPRDHWRLFPLLRDQAVALDIETNGFSPQQGGYVTVVGLYDGMDYRALVRGSSLGKQRLEQELKAYSYLITFFGSVFDMPFLHETLGVRFTGLHFDLCFAARSIGMKGGLKKLEQQQGLTRPQTVSGFDGYDAVRLWHAARQGSEEALSLLVEYNRCDTVNLFPLAERMYELLRAATGFDRCGSAFRSSAP